MNKSFKTVWNTARRCYVAVNEKVSGAAQASGKSGALVAALVAATMVAGVAQANPNPDEEVAGPAGATLPAVAPSEPTGVAGAQPGAPAAGDQGSKDEKKAEVVVPGVYKTNTTIDLSKITAETQFVSVTDNATVNLTNKNEAPISFKTKNTFAVEAGTVNVQKGAVMTLKGDDEQTIMVGVKADAEQKLDGSVGKFVNDGKISADDLTLSSIEGSSVLNNGEITVTKDKTLKLNGKGIVNNGSIVAPKVVLNEDATKDFKNNGTILTAGLSVKEGSVFAVKGNATLGLVAEVTKAPSELAPGLYTDKADALKDVNYVLAVGDVTVPDTAPEAGSLLVGSNGVVTITKQANPVFVFSKTQTVSFDKGAKVVVAGLKAADGKEQTVKVLTKGEADKAALEGLAKNVEFSTLGDEKGYDYSIVTKADVTTGIELTLKHKTLAESYPDAVYMPEFVILNKEGKPEVDEQTNANKTRDVYAQLAEILKAKSITTLQADVTAKQNAVKTSEQALKDANEQGEKEATDKLNADKAALAAAQDKYDDAMAALGGDLQLIEAVITNQNASFADRTVALNAAFAPAATAGVGFATIGAADLVTDGIYGHIDTVKASKNLWVNLLGARVNGKDDAFDFGKTTTGYKSTKYGAVVGFDMPVATGANAGVAVSYVKDKVENKGAYSAENKVNTFGITAYGRYALTDSIKVDGQLSYLHGENKITDTVATKAVDAKVKTNAFVASVRGGMDFAVSSFTVTPHIGLNVIYAKQGSFDTNYDGKKITNTSAKASTTVELPVGVTAKMAMDVKGWKVAPQADLSIAPIFGNRNTKYTITGVSGGTSEFEAQFAGKYAATAGLGVMAENKAGVSVGAFYNAVKTKNGLDNQMKIEIQKAF